MLLRTTFGSLAATVALVLTPSAALAGPYPGDAETMVVTDTNPEEGEPFEVVVDAGTGADNDEVSLTVTSQDPGVPDSDIEIAGSQSMTKSTVAGKARFTVTLYAEDAYTLVGRDEFGNVISRATVVVGDGAAGDGDGDGDGDADGDDGAAGGLAGAGAAGGLGATGASAGTTALAVGGGALVLAGGALLLVRRRRVETTA